MKIKSIDQLVKISQKISDNLSKKDFILLIGDIGVGKTTLTRMIINYLQKKNGLKISEVLSPTFNILYEYDLKFLKIMHYDLYRLNDSTDVSKLGIFDEDQETVKIVEWPKLIKKMPMQDKLEVHLDYVKNEKERDIKLVGTGKWKNLINELQT